MPPRWNHLALAFLAGLAVEAAAAIGLAFLFANSSERFQFSAIAFLFLVLMPVPFGLWYLVKSWLVFWLFERSRMKRVFLAHLYKQNFPSSKFHSDIEEYLQEIVSDKIRSDAVRLQAARLIGELAATRDLRPYTRGIQAIIAFNDAISEYDRQPTLFTDMSKRSELEIELDPDDLK